ncbi:hypothetical protein AB3N59_14280 [Leptospira sp. WS92.C1]
MITLSCERKNRRNDSLGIVNPKADRVLWNRFIFKKLNFILNLSRMGPEFCDPVIGIMLFYHSRRFVLKNRQFPKNDFNFLIGFF